MTAVRRVTVIAPKARVDVSLPAQSTVMELVPQLVRICGAETEQPTGIVGWELRRLGAAPLQPEASVDDAGVRDGEILYLSPRDRRHTPLLFDDVVDAIASAAAQLGAWRPALSRQAGLLAGGAAFAGVAVMLFAVGPQGLVARLAAALAVVLLIAAGALARAYGDAGAGAALAAAGLPHAFVAGARLFAGPGPGLRLDVPQMAVGCAALAAYAALAAVLVAHRSAWLVSAAAGAAVAGVTLVLDMIAAARPTATAAVLAVVIVLGNPVLPTLALRLGRLPLPRVPTDAAAFRRDEEPTTGPEVGENTATAIQMLTGLTAASALLVDCACVVLLGARSRPAWLLAGLLGLVLVLRARAYLAAGSRSALLIAGAAVLACAAVRFAVASDPAGRLLVGTVVLVVGTICTAHGVRASAGSASPYWSRLLDVVEFLALVSLVPLAGSLLGLYAAVRGWGG